MFLRAFCARFLLLNSTDYFFCNATGILYQFSSFVFIIQSLCDLSLALPFFSFHPGRAVSILCWRTVWRNWGSRHQWWETSENLCSPSRGATIANSSYDSPSKVDLRSIDHVYKNQFGKHLDKLVREETGGHYRNTLLGLLPHGRTRWEKPLLH